MIIKLLHLLVIFIGPGRVVNFTVIVAPGSTSVGAIPFSNVDAESILSTQPRSQQYVPSAAVICVAATSIFGIV